MSTERLIDALSADAGTPPVRLGRAFATALGLAVFGAGVAFFAILHPRHDIAQAIETVRFPLKFVFTAALGVSAGMLLMRLSRPGAQAKGAVVALLLVPVALGAAVLIEMMVTPSDVWGARMVGKNALLCLASIPMLSALPLAALLYGMRSGAPASPARAGAVAGLLASGVGATFYAAHCTDDSPLFVAVWYVVAVAIVSGAGALIGSRALRW